MNESQHETPQKDGKNADAEKATSSEKKKDVPQSKEELSEKHKQQSEAGKSKAASDDRQDEEPRKDKKEASAPLKLQRNDVKAPESDRKSRSRSR